MKAIPTTLLTFLTLAVACRALRAADPPRGSGVAARVAPLLERFPAEKPAARDALCAELLGLGPGAVAEVCASVRPPGKGDDARARFALNGLAVYVTRPGAEQERASFARDLLGCLDRTRDEQVAAFLLSQVQVVGRKESIRPLARCLVDEKLAGPAVAALVSIGGVDAAKTLRDSLGRAPRAVRPALVDALGGMRSRESVRALLPLSDDADAATRQAALFALANIGDPAAGPVLARSRVAAPFRERAQAPALYLLYARRLVESGRTAEGLAAARSILETYRRPEEAAHASAALDLVVSALGVRALPDLLAAAESPDRGLRGAALALASSAPGGAATARWVERAAASPPDVRADIVDMLGRRGDAAALPFVRECLVSSEPVVRRAAIPALARLGGESALPDLVKLLATAREPEIPALKTALLRYPGPVVVPEVVRLLDSVPPPVEAALVEILGEKGARGEIERVYRLAEDPDPAVREAALEALGNLAGDADLPRLVAMLEKASDTNDVVRLREGIAAAVRRNPDREHRADALLDLLKTATTAGKLAILPVLPRVGGARPLGATVAEVGSAEPEVQTAAVAALARWPEPAAAEELLRIASTRPEHFRTAVQGYVRLVGRSELPAARKIEAFQKVLALPAEDADRKPILAGMAGVRDPGSLRLLARLLDNPVLRDTAASSLLDLASRQFPDERWLSGHEAYSVLRRVEAAFSDPAAKARASKVILDRLKQGGFVPLFDGRSLEGWKGLVGDPPSRAKMAPAELAAAQATADETMRAHWKAEDGALVFDGKGESLCTARDYGDFELLADWRIEKGGDSGLYLRGSPQVQVWDPDANPEGSGGLYNNKIGPSHPSERADRPVGEWNSFRVIMVGDRVTVYLNDRRVVDNVVLENYWEREKPIYPTGPIELQAHGNPLWFRNVFVREIPRDPAGPAPADVDVGEGFTPLFDGRDLEGWTGNVSGYAAEDGKIVVHPERSGGNLYTSKEYTDFVLRFEFKLTPAANNGIGIRAPLEGDAAYAGMEIQVLEDGSPVYWDLQPYQYHGSIYGVVPARRGVLKPVGEWNAEEITVKGRRVTVVVNGVTVVDADLDEASAGGTMDHRDHPGLARTSGHVGFLGHRSIVEFRNVRIKEIR
jgi:HEAT repeat protein